MEPQTYKNLIQSLRDLYVERKFTELKAKYLLSRWMIKPEDRVKIEKVLCLTPPGEQTVLEYAEEYMSKNVRPELDKRLKV